MRIKRKLYPRGSSFETTIPKPLLFALNLENKQNVIFDYDPKKKRWYIDFEEEESEESSDKKGGEDEDG